MNWTVTFFRRTLPDNLHWVRRGMPEDLVKYLPFTVLAVILLFAVTPAASSPLEAQSAEELLALMIWGLDPASQSERANTWKVEDHDGERATISVSRLSDCLFSASVERRLARTGHILQIGYSFDFAAVRDYSVWFANDKDQRIITKVEGNAWYDQRAINQVDGRTVQSIKQGRIHAFVAAGGPIERLRAAFEEFRINHCKTRSP